MAILSELPDGCGYFYGFLPDDPRQINVRKIPGDHVIGDRWEAFVGEVQLETLFSSKREAEEAAITWALANPVSQNDDE